MIDLMEAETDFEESEPDEFAESSPIGISSTLDVDPMDIEIMKDDADDDEEAGLEETEHVYQEHSDPLSMYLDEISAVPLLKKHEETEIAERLWENRRRATNILFSLPLAVEKLISAAEAAINRESSLNEIIRLPAEPGRLKENEKRRFATSLDQIVLLHRKEPRACSEDLVSQIMDLELRFGFVTRIWREISDVMKDAEGKIAGLSSGKADAGRRRSRERTGSDISGIRKVTQAFAELCSQVNEDRNSLIERNLRLVVSVAKKYAGISKMSMSDLIQEGNIGLMRAADLFDCRMGYRFSTYAMCWIKQAITRGMSNHSRMIRLPAHTADDLGRIIRTAKQIAKESGEEPSPEQLAERMKMPTQVLNGLLDISRDPISLHMPVGDKAVEMMDFIEDKTIPSPLDSLINSDLCAKVMKAISKLDKKEARVLRCRFNIGSEKLTLETLAREFGLSRERIRQIERGAITKLKAHFAAAGV